MIAAFVTVFVFLVAAVATLPFRSAAAAPVPPCPEAAELTSLTPTLF